MNPALTPEEMDAEDRHFLLELARTTIAAGLGDRPFPSPMPDSAFLLETRGAFVTLKIDGALRGCIGHVIGVAPLWRAVRDNAAAAAFDDPRFPPLTADELKHAHIEISVLTPLCRSSAEEVVVGRHGVLIECGAARGLLLPQVATEYGWDRETFLDHTCRKAGLEPGSWRRPETAISTFSAEVFAEKRLNV
jgi:AmmeMemoRadiSam system protein A